MTPEDIQALFTRADDSFLFARWARPIVPIIFGVSEESLPVLKGAAEAVVALAGHKMAETDPELGANLMIFFLKDWAELLETPKLDELVPNLAQLTLRLQAEDANQYRFFRFEPEGAIQAGFVFLRMDASLSDLPADVLALTQMVQSILVWSDRAFSDTSPLAKLPGGETVLKPEIAGLIRAAYDPVLPDMSEDPSVAFRLSARLSVTQ